MPQIQHQNLSPPQPRLRATLVGGLDHLKLIVLLEFGLVQKLRLDVGQMLKLLLDRQIRLRC